MTDTERRDVRFATVMLSLMAFASGLIVGEFLGRRDGSIRIQQEAVAAGAAHWTADEEGRAVFTWRECE